MNPFDKINQMKDILKDKAKNINGEDMITQYEHYKEMLNMLNIITEELKTAEYNYEVQNLESESYHTFEELAFSQTHLTDDVILIQAVGVNTDELMSIDMQSLCNVFGELRDSGKIKEDIVIIPPYINVLRARLAAPKSDNSNNNEK